MRVKDIRLGASRSVLLALYASNKPMTTLELMDETGLSLRSVRYGVDELRGLCAIVETRCNIQLYGECRVEYRLSKPFTAYAAKDIRELCEEADDGGYEGANIG